MNIAELAATLGWDVDFETIAKYQSELNRSREATKQLEADTKKLAAAEALAAEMRGRGIGPGGGGDPARALALISPGAPGAGGAAVADRAAGATRGWGRASSPPCSGPPTPRVGRRTATSSTSFPAT